MLDFSETGLAGQCHHLLWSEEVDERPGRLHVLPSRLAEAQDGPQVMLPAFDAISACAGRMCPGRRRGRGHHRRAG